VTALAALLALAAAAGPATPSAADIVRAQIAATEVELSHRPAHFFRLSAASPEVSDLRCNVVAANRVSCRYRWRVSADQPRRLHFGDYVRLPGGLWSVWPVPRPPTPMPVLPARGEGTS
jgi:hypothetical protein